MWKKQKSDQRGFTLIELIVTIMIMSIVMVAAAGFIITAANSYRVANIELELQTEAQAAMNQLNDILIEAKRYEFREVDGKTRLTVVTPIILCWIRKRMSFYFRKVWVRVTRLYWRATVNRSR